MVRRRKFIGPAHFASRMALVCDGSEKVGRANTRFLACRATVRKTEGAPVVTGESYESVLVHNKRRR